MASNNSSGPRSGNNTLPNHVTVRVITLAHSDRTENDLYLVLNLDTTVGELKQRIQDGLSQRPPPETQRLLYHGRPLLENNAILRQILRQEQTPGNAGTSYVLHLVIRESQDSHTQRSVTQSQTTGLPPPPRVQLNNPQFGQIQVPQIPAGIPDFAHNIIHNSVHMMQHQMQHQRAVEEATRRARGVHNHVNPLANEGGSTVQANPHGQLQTQTQAQSPQNGPPSSSPAQPPPAIQVTQTPQMLGLPMAEPPPHPVPNAPPPSIQTTRIQETIGPNGERIRTVVNNNSMMFQIAGSNLPNPFDRPSSAPGASPPASSDPTNRHDGSAVPPVHFHPPPPMLPPGFPFPQGRHLPLPAPPVPSLAIPMLLNTAASVPNPGQTVAWLLSSPQGPQGIVFAPGHGYFSSNAPSATVLSQAPNQSLQPTPTVPSDAVQPETQSAQRSQQQNATPASGQVQGNPPPPQPGARPQPDVPGPARAGAPAQQPANNENDLLQLLVNRGWLFLRLYMFVFIFSESGTWRRIIMLGSSIIFCLLPQQNRLTDMFNVMRRHFDRLIGPPPIPERQPANPLPRQNQQQLQQNQGQQNNNQPVAAVGATQAGNQGTANANGQQNPNTGRQMPTPEETARRLLAQHQDRRNAHPFLDLLYRIEQGAALFFASLVPGVGERHVRAREEARRIVEADDRRLREESERQNQSVGGGENKSANAAIEAGSSTNPTTTVSSSGTGEASSSGVDPTGSSNGQQDLRSRNAGGGNGGSGGLGS